MAKIKGIELKNIKTFSGMEYPVNYQGTVYIKGKKAGIWSQNGNGGPDNFYFNTKEFDQIVKDYYGDEYEILASEIFMDELLRLIDMEKAYKKAIKEGYKTLFVCTDGYKNLMIKEPKMTDRDEIIKAFDHYIKDFTKKAVYKDRIEIKVFSDIADFNIK